MYCVPQFYSFTGKSVNKLRSLEVIPRSIGVHGIQKKRDLKDMSLKTRRFYRSIVPQVMIEINEDDYWQNEQLRYKESSRKSSERKDCNRQGLNRKGSERRAISDNSATRLAVSRSGVVEKKVIGMLNEQGRSKRGD